MSTGDHGPLALTTRRTVLAALALLACTALAYLPASRCGFIWDDDRHVTENPALRSPQGLLALWTDTSTTPQYYPLTHTTFWIEYRLWGLDPRGYHLVNVALHGAAAVVLFLLLRALSVPAAWLAAALFALHPIQVESVAWVSERKNVLSGLLYLASLLCWVRYFRLDRVRDDRPVRGPGLAAAGGGLYGLALLSKTVTASLPVTLLLLFGLRRRRPTPRAAWIVGGMLAAGAAMGSLTSWLERHQVGALGEEWSLAPLERLLVAGRVWWFYLGQLAWPDDLTFIYPRWEIDASSPWGYLAPAAVALALGGCLLGLRRLGPGPLVALLHYSVALAPASGLFDVYPMRYSFVADHFQYLAGIGPLALAAAVGTVLVRRAGSWPAASRRIVAAGVLIVLAVATWQRQAAFRDAESLWTDTLSRNPGAWIAHNNLGILYADRGREQEAVTHFRSAIELEPGHAGARVNLGWLLLGRGRPEEALPLLLRARELAPDRPNVHVALAETRLALSDPSGAEESFAAALALDPAHPRACYGLGDLRLGQRRWAEAEELLRRALAAAPRDASTRFKLGTALGAQGRTGEAIEHYRAALALRPDDADAHYNMGTLLARSGRVAEGISHFEQALRLRPDFAEARRNLALARELLRGERGRP